LLSRRDKVLTSNRFDNEIIYIILLFRRGEVEDLRPLISPDGQLGIFHLRVKLFVNVPMRQKLDIRTWFDDWLNKT